MTRATWMLAVALLFGLLACTPRGSNRTDEAASSSQIAETSGTCATLNLLSPTGRPVNLTGTWTAFESTFLAYAVQRGDCVWWVGGFSTPYTSLARSFDGLGPLTLTFRGKLDPSFSVRGDWAIVRSETSVRAPDRTSGTATLQITFGEGQEEAVTLVTTEAPGAYIVDSMTKVSDNDIRSGEIPPP